MVLRHKISERGDFCPHGKETIDDAGWMELTCVLELVQFEANKKSYKRSSNMNITSISMGELFLLLFSGNEARFEIAFMMPETSWATFFSLSTFKELKDCEEVYSNCLVFLRTMSGHTANVSIHNSRDLSLRVSTVIDPHFADLYDTWLVHGTDFEALEAIIKCGYLDPNAQKTERNRHGRTFVQAARHCV